MDEEGSFILNWKFKLMLWLTGRAELRLILVRKVSMRGARYDIEMLWPAG